MDGIEIFIEIIGEIADIFLWHSVYGNKNNSKQLSSTRKRDVKNSIKSIQDRKTALVVIMHGLAYYDDLWIDKEEQKMINKVIKDKNVFKNVPGINIEEIKEVSTNLKETVIYFQQKRMKEIDIYNVIHDVRSVITNHNVDQSKYNEYLDELRNKIKDIY